MNTPRTRTIALLLAAPLLLLAACNKPAPAPQAGASPSGEAAPADRETQLSAKEQELQQREAEIAIRERELELAAREEALAKQEGKPKPAPAPSAAPKRKPAEPAVASRSSAAAEASKPAAKPVVKPVLVPAGTQMTVSLNTDLSTQTARQGDSFDAKVANDIVVNGRRAVPAGARVTGSVTDVISGHNRIGGVPTLGLRFDSLVLDDGQIVQINGELTEQGNSDTTRDTAKILGGAAAGAILGHQVKNNDGGKIIGGLLGGAIGAVAARKTGTEVQLAAGSPLTIVLGAGFEVMPPK